MKGESTGDSISRLLDLLERAIDATAEGITISDALQPDNPVVFANKGFERLTGYAAHEIVGRNCRFLQGPQSDLYTVREIRQAIEQGIECTVELLNYRKDGTPFWNRLSIAPLRDRSGRITHFAGIQSDITELRETQERLEAANRELVRFERRITQELDQARDAQRSLLPQEMPRDDRLCFAHKYVPLAEIGGDFFDVIELDRGIYGILVADVTGHGIHAALLAFMSAISFKNAAPGQSSTKAVLNRVNELLHGKMHGGNFVAMFYAIVDVNRRTLTYTQAGIPPGLLIRPGDGQIMLLEAKSPLLGLFDGLQFAEETVRLAPGDKVLFYTDAVTEAIRADGEMMGIGGLRSFLEQRGDLGIEALVEQVYAYGQRFSGQAQYEDDFTLVGLEIQSSAGERITF
jgi:sigma-B regulation protein RsbU (phosphoserine phosphatase)